MSTLRFKHSTQDPTAGQKGAKRNPALSETSENKVRALAYQIWESNGRRDHRADQDWLNAEQEILKRGRSG
jgi:DUF2934 family protein